MVGDLAKACGLDKYLVLFMEKLDICVILDSCFNLSLLPNIFIEPTQSTANFCIMNDILFLILQRLAVPRVCNSSHDYVLPY